MAAVSDKKAQFSMISLDYKKNKKDYSRLFETRGSERALRSALISQKRRIEEVIRRIEADFFKEFNEMSQFLQCYAQNSELGSIIKIYTPRLETCFRLICRPGHVMHIPLNFLEMQEAISGLMLELEYVQINDVQTDACVLLIKQFKLREAVCAINKLLKEKQIFFYVNYLLLMDQLTTSQFAAPPIRAEICVVPLMNGELILGKDPCMQARIEWLETRQAMNRLKDEMLGRLVLCSQLMDEAWQAVLRTRKRVAAIQ